MSNQDYHTGQGSFAYSKSLLSLLLPPLGNPRALRAEIDTPVEDVFSEKSLRTYNPGTALHTWFLEPEKFTDKIVVMPERATAAWKEEFRTMTPHKTPIRPVVMKMIEGMDRSLHSGFYETARSIIEAPTEKFIERSGFWQDKKTGVWLKTRPDLIANNTVIWDLKTMGTTKPFGSQVVALHYDLQAYMMALGVSIITDHTHTHVGFIVFHNIPPSYPVEVFICDDEVMESGKDKFEEAMPILAACIEADEWPGLEDKVQVLFLPEWRRRELGLD